MTINWKALRKKNKFPQSIKRINLRTSLKGKNRKHSTEAKSYKGYPYILGEWVPEPIKNRQGYTELQGTLYWYVSIMDNLS